MTAMEYDSARTTQSVYTLVPDPDYTLARTLTRWAGEAGFKVKEKLGSFFAYSLSFEKRR